MTVKIEKKIVSYNVLKKDKKSDEVNEVVKAVPETVKQVQTEIDDEANLPTNVVRMHEKVARPEMLLGSTYKIKTPLSEHSLYVTINDIILNPATPYEKRRPFEIFINSKNMDHFQWIVALTRIISAVFRKGGDATFLVEELRSVFDPKGGYFKRGGKFTPSLVAEIGDAIEAHMKMIGMIKDNDLDEHQQALVDEKRREYEARTDFSKPANDSAVSDFPSGAQLCVKCTTQAVVLMDGCMTCLNCGDSKCG